MDIPLKNPFELAARLGLIEGERVLLVDAPAPVGQLLLRSRPAGQTEVAPGQTIRSVKQRFDAILLWRENRVGSRVLFEHVQKRLEASGVLWVVIAMKKVKGPKTPAGHRLELEDLRKAFSRAGLTHDREVRVSAWHMAHRFVATSAVNRQP